MFNNIIIIIATFHMACFHHTCMHRKAHICFILHLHVCHYLAPGSIEDFLSGPSPERSCTCLLYKIRGFTPTDSAITLYTHKLWHRLYFFNLEVPYWLQSSITASAFRGLLLILQKNSMLTDTKIFRSRMGAFRCIDTRYPSRVRNRIR